MRIFLLLGVVFLVSACGSPTAPERMPVCTVEQHALSPVTQRVDGVYILLDSGPLTPVTVCR